ncbi:MAG TPA: prepilin-type N-terminal cleavage/methylation domain-containing protein [Candidatus Limnocylindrales bacterium]|nr:prepilin-type N-terminal cleavage/methylation domain-containing protein [Candidatus Limnocylindrales bacterium]
MIQIQRSLKILKSESGLSLVEMMIVVAIMGILSIILYDLNLSILTSNLFIEVKNDLSLQGQQALNPIKNRLISSRLLLVDSYVKPATPGSGTWTGLGSYYIQYLQPSSQYPPLPTIILPSGTYCPPGCPSNSDYQNVIVRSESRMVTGQTLPQAITQLVPLNGQAAFGLSATSIGNSILFIETMPARQVRHTFGGVSTDYLIDAYRLNYYYLSQNNSNSVAGKNYYIDLIQWESQEFADYGQFLQIATYIKQQNTSDTPVDIINQLKNPTTSPFPAERGRPPLRYAWDVGKAGTINISNIAGSILGNFYCLDATAPSCTGGYITTFDPTNNNTSDDFPLTLVSSTFRIPSNQVKSLLPGLYAGASQGRSYYTIAFNNDANSNLNSAGLIPQNIPQLVPLRFNPYDTSGYATEVGASTSKFMGGFEIGVVSQTVGYQVNLRLVLMGDTGGILRRMISNETVVLAAPRG